MDFEEIVLKTRGNVDLMLEYELKDFNEFEKKDLIQWDSNTNSLILIAFRKHENYDKYSPKCRIDLIHTSQDKIWHALLLEMNLTPSIELVSDLPLVTVSREKIYFRSEEHDDEDNEYLCSNPRV